MRQENDRLAASGLALRLERRGGRLALRGPLPCPRGGPQRVQRLSLGLEATSSGLIQARRELKRVSQALRQKRFDWSDWGRSQASTSGLERLKAFEGAFFADPRRRRNPAGSRTTWTAAYQPYVRRLRVLLEQGEPLTSALLVQVLEAYPPASRSRQQCGTALAALARQLELPLPEDWCQRASGYGLHQAQYRRLPSDAQLLEWVERIPNPRWRMVYGLMATYGLRNHEVFFADLSALAPGGDRVIRVLPTTKTGEHQVWPFQPEWVDRFELAPLGERSELLPAVCTDLRRTTLQQVGRRVAEQFRRYDLPCTPYDLRHAWAVRTIHIGLPDTVAARMMGHSVAIHTRTYHHWITRRDQQQAVDAALARLRPTP
ncbi:site-specific integrase [Synechococcus sp. BSF8S]|nr:MULTISPECIES: site-specific integrase [unclassified Synechococcus]MBC1260846.1 site-specific integrase [Synechococcus sp. BSF8S]MBC1263522.1 site-specific integrase [Synechococcus sp. BSA11S]